MDERAVNELRQLSALDAELAESASALRRLDATVEALRGRAEEIDAFFVSYSGELGRRSAELKDAHEEVSRRQEELAAAQRVLAETRDVDARVHAEHAVERALDHIVVAEGRSARAQSAYDALQQEAEELPRERAELYTRARAVPNVPPLSDSLIDWAARAHAELFVAAGQIDVQRERIIREANELASLLLGEPTYHATVAQALARVDNH